MAGRVLGGRYRIDRHLARGGMAEVYLGHDQLLDRPVAVKVLFPELARDESFVVRFRREAQSAARLNNPNIVSVYDFGQDHDAYFIVMEYVPGPTLAAIIATDGPMAPARAIEIGAAVAAGLAAAHVEGIIHRDVKPANVLLAGQVAKVADFGIARAADARQDLTMPGAVIGTATYLSPEQAQGLPVDQRSDVYSLGMVIYEMLTGWAPFRADNPVAVAYKQQHETPPPPSQLNRAVPAQLDAVVGRAMAINPADRQATAENLRAELAAVGHGPIGAEETVALASPGATAVFASAGATTEATSTAPDAATGMLPRSRADDGDANPAASVPKTTPDAVYRRRRLTALVALIVLLLAVIGGAVALNSGSTSTPTVTVPSVIGQPVADATATLDHAGLKAHTVEANRPGPAGQVLDQTPAGGSHVARGTIVSLIVPGATTTTSSPSHSGPRPTTSTPTTKPAPTTVTPAPPTGAPTTGATVTTPPATTAVATTKPPHTTTSGP